MAELAAATLAELHGLELYAYMAHMLGVAWNAYWDSASGDPWLACLVLTRWFREQGILPPGHRPEPQVWFAEVLNRLLPRAACAAWIGEHLLALAEAADPPCGPLERVLARWPMAVTGSIPPAQAAVPTLQVAGASARAVAALERLGWRVVPAPPEGSGRLRAKGRG